MHARMAHSPGVMHVCKADTPVVMYVCMTHSSRGDGMHAWQSTDRDPSFWSGQDHTTQQLQELQGQRALEGGVLARKWGWVVAFLIPSPSL